ncbi:unnamed protein product [Boreogadus saida]
MGNTATVLTFYVRANNQTQHTGLLYLQMLQGGLGLNQCFYPNALNLQRCNSLDTLKKCNVWPITYCVKIISTCTPPPPPPPQKRTSCKPLYKVYKLCEWLCVYV